MRFLPRSPSTRLDVLIVGAGPAGVGCAVALKACGVENLAILERRGVGASFESWPAQMRMITPSFHSNPFGQVDLNAITPQTSPADYLGREHPSGVDYARYLRAVADFYRLPVESGVEVISVKKKGREFVVETSEGKRRARFVIWAAGEFFQPHRGDIAGSDHCLHNSEVEDWSDLPGVDHAIIGGFESGIDAAVHLARAGKSMHVFSRGEPWHSDHSDPSRTLTPFTRDRLKAAFLEAPGSNRFHKNADIVEVKDLGDRYVLLDREDVPFEVSTAPILCTGLPAALFGGDYGLVAMFPFLILYAAPTILVFSAILAIYKSSGLIDRLSVALHPWLRPFGIGGRDLVRVVMGFGCNVPAVIASRACHTCSRGACVSAISFGSACSYQLHATLAVFAAAGMAGMGLTHLLLLAATTLIYLRFTTPKALRLAGNGLLLPPSDPLHRPSWRAVWREMAGNLKQFVVMAWASGFSLVIAWVGALLF